MVKVCCVTDCNKEYRAAVRFSFINIPKCPKRIKEWEAITALNLSENSVICKDHFKEEDFVPESPNLLTPNAVPSLFPKVSRVEGISTTELTSATCLKTEVKDEPEDTYENDNEQAQNYTEITIEKHDPDELLAAARNRENEAVVCKREYNNGGSDGSSPSKKPKCEAPAESQVDIIALDSVVKTANWNPVVLLTDVAKTTVKRERKPSADNYLLSPEHLVERTESNVSNPDADSVAVSKKAGLKGKRNASKKGSNVLKNNAKSTLKSMVEKRKSRYSTDSYNPPPGMLVRMRGSRRHCRDSDFDSDFDSESSNQSHASGYSIDSYNPPPGMLVRMRTKRRSYSGSDSDSDSWSSNQSYEGRASIDNCIPSPELLEEMSKAPNTSSAESDSVSLIQTLCKKSQRKKTNAVNNRKKSSSKITKENRGSLKKTTNSKVKNEPTSSKTTQKKAGRGRPKKSTDVNVKTEPSSPEVTQSKAKRGRPKKTTTTTASSNSKTKMKATSLKKKRNKPRSDEDEWKPKLNVQYLNRITKARSKGGFFWFDPDNCYLDD